MTTSPINLPAGFRCYTANIGVKDESSDLVVLATGHPAPAAGVFTQNLFVGPSVTISRDHLGNGRAAAVVVISKNANVANGMQGVSDANEVCELVAQQLGQDAEDVLIASTGVIGRPYPMDRVRTGLAQVPATPQGVDAVEAATAMMTTDTFPKAAEAPVGDSGARVVGIAKGVGMIEPNMATMIAILCTDAEVAADVLDRSFRRAVDKSFNSVSIDTDTSTSDTAVILASGIAGRVSEEDFDKALVTVCTELTKMIARDGEGAETLIEVTVDAARDQRQAKLIAKSIVNSPLVKTAVHGADPNWGRVAMAVGKCESETDINPDNVIIRFGDTEVFPRQLGASELAGLSSYLAGDEVRIHVSLGTGSAEWTVWGCDLTDGYVRINADYTT